MILLFLSGAAGCAAPTWTAEGALAPTLARLDADGDGRVEAAEYAPLDHAQARFAALDADGSGALTAAELAAWVRAADPLDFERQPGRLPPRPGAGPAAPDPYEVRVLDELLRFLAEEITAVDPAWPVPDAAEIAAAARAGSLAAPQVQALLRRLQAGYAAVGLVFPPRLAAILAPP